MSEPTAAASGGHTGLVQLLPRGHTGRGQGRLAAEHLPALLNNAHAHLYPRGGDITDQQTRQRVQSRGRSRDCDKHYRRRGMSCGRLREAAGGGGRSGQYAFAKARCLKRSLQLCAPRDKSMLQLERGGGGVGSSGKGEAWETMNVIAPAYPACPRHRPPPSSPPLPPRHCKQCEHNRAGQALGTNIDVR